MHYMRYMHAMHLGAVRPAVELDGFLGGACQVWLRLDCGDGGTKTAHVLCREGHNSAPFDVRVCGACGQPMAGNTQYRACVGAGREVRAVSWERGESD